MVETNIMLPRIYDKNMNYIDRFEPTRVGYELMRNKISTATIDIDGADKLPVLPEVCQFVRLYETWGSIGVFRVQAVDIERSDGEDRTYQLEHAISTLADGCIDGYREFGGTGTTTAQVITALLDRQPKRYWTLGECDFNYEYQYSFENDDLLSAVFSVAATITDDYIWTYDMDVFPFVLNLKKVENGDASELRMNRNIKSVKISIDRESLCTRLYPKGYGEGTNQLTIADVNDGKRYLDADTQSTYGIVSKQWVDTTFTSARLLRRTANTVLNRLKEPLVTTVFEAYELYELTGETLDRFYLGRLVRAPLPAYNTTIRERVVSIAKKDVYRRNEDATITLTNKSSDVTDDMAELVRKATIGELYSQGATNMYAEHYADNASETKPLVCKFYIDEGCVHINAVLLEFSIENFRSYSATSEAGGGSSQTSSSGGGGSTNSTDGGACTAWTIGDVATTPDIDMYTGGPYTAIGHFAMSGTEYADGPGSHRHSMNHHHLNRHQHTITIPSLQVDIGNHQHSVSLGTHSHSVDIPAHSHNIEHGIYEGGRASSVTIKVDGNDVPDTAVSNGSVDLVAYLNKDSNGKITRNTWHRIEITPNSLTRIVADVFVKTFIRSIGGGTY